MSEDPIWDQENHTHSPQKSTDALISELKDLLPAADDVHRCVEKVVSDYRQKMPHDVHNVNNLLEAFNTALKEETSQKQKETGSWLSISRPAFMKPAPKMKVFPVVAAKTFGADRQILKAVDADVCGSPADCDVVVVFCPVTSRVGSDVDDALRNIPDRASGKKVILLVMHHSRKDISSTETHLNHGHQNVIQDVHVVYHETVKGLIKCDRNSHAIETLKEWGKRFTP